MWNERQNLIFLATTINTALITGIYNDRLNSIYYLCLYMHLIYDAKNYIIILLISKNNNWLKLIFLYF